LRVRICPVSVSTVSPAAILSCLCIQLEAHSRQTT
jgi:hypothetical protein